MKQRFHVIKDPVHGTMQFTDMENRWIKPFIDSEPMQRLRHIKQLGMGDYIFPGAVHTRFNHALGCCYLASQIAQKIDLTLRERQCVMIAALLHDIGHGPFSHTFEEVFQQKSIRHEIWTQCFLNQYAENAFLENYNDQNPDAPLDRKILTTIQNIITHKQEKRSVLRDIVSSQLDADRLDYLLRDSHFCGVRYGEFDLRWLIHCLTPISTPNGDRLGITYKGIGAVEQYLMARRLMLRNIYQSQKKIAFESYLVNFLKLLASDETNLRNVASLKTQHLTQFLQAVQQFNSTAKSHKNIEVFLTEQFHHYKSLCDYDIFIALHAIKAQGKGALKELSIRILERHMPHIVRLDNRDETNLQVKVSEFLYENQCIEPWQLQVIRMPHQAYTDEADPILVINESDEIAPISEYSLMLDALTNKYEHLLFLSVDRKSIDDPKVKKFLKQLGQ